MGQALDPHREVLVVLDAGGVAERIVRAIGDAGFYPIRADGLREARVLLENASVRPCVILVFLARGAPAEDLLALLAGSPSSKGIPLVMFSTGEDEAPLVAPQSALVTTLVKMVEQHCAR